MDESEKKILILNYLSIMMKATSQNGLKSFDEAAINEAKAALIAEKLKMDPMEILQLGFDYIEKQL